MPLWIIYGSFSFLQDRHPHTSLRNHPNGIMQIMGCQQKTDRYGGPFFAGWEA